MSTTLNTLQSELGLTDATLFSLVEQFLTTQNTLDAFAAFVREAAEPTPPTPYGFDEACNEMDEGDEDCVLVIGEVGLVDMENDPRTWTDSYPVAVCASRNISQDALRNLLEKTLDTHVATTCHLSSDADMQSLTIYAADEFCNVAEYSKKDNQWNCLNG